MVKQIKLIIEDKTFIISSQAIMRQQQHSVWLNEQEIVSSLTSEDFWEWAANEIKYIVESKGDV